MNPDLLIGLLSGLLIASLVGNGALYLVRAGAAATWRQRALAAEDAKKAQELRSGEQIDALLDRVRTSPRLEVAAPVTRKVDPDARLYFPDTEDADADWNTYRGEPAVGDEPEAIS